MRKSIINVFAMLLVAGVAFVSCSKESSEIESPSNGYKVSIPANKISSKAVADGGTATFKTTENVYVCNTSNGNAIDANVLHPSANAASANFDGTLAGTYAVGNNLKILYNTNASGVADYSSQNGTLAGVVDAGVATVSVTSVGSGTITTGTATIDNLQSIFKFTFKNGSTTLNVKSVTITSLNNALQSQYDVVEGTPTYAPITVTLSSAQSTVYAALRFTATANDPIYFVVTDNDNKKYSGVKYAPVAGFAIGKFYNSTVNVGAFSIASGVQVYFSPGNLVKTDGSYEVGSGSETYAFETVPFNTNGGSLGYNQGTPTTTSARGYFTWSEIATANETPRSFTVNGISGWKAMTFDEWNYLLWEEYKSIDDSWHYGRNMNSGVNRFYIVDLGDNGTQVGMLIPPDQATSSDVADLEEDPDYMTENVNLETYLSKGFVFLPATGYCSVGYMGTFWEEAGDNAYYWYTTEDEEDSEKAYFLNYYDCGLSDSGTEKKAGRSFYSIRLVHD